MKKQIAIIGPGGFAKEVICLIADLGRYDDIACVMEADPEWEKHWQGKNLLGIPVLPQSQFDPGKYTASIAIASSKIREKVINDLPQETEYETLIHPMSTVSRWAELGAGAIVQFGCIITADIVIGRHSQINTLSAIGHDVVIGDYFTVASHGVVNGFCKIGNHVYFGSHAGVRQGLSVCDDVVLGMGALAVKNIEEPGVYIGNPAKKMERK